MSNQTTDQLTEAQLSQIPVLDFVRSLNKEMLEWGAANDISVALQSENSEWYELLGIRTALDLSRSNLIESISDLHKEAFGVRPVDLDYENMTFNELRAMVEEMVEEARCDWFTKGVNSLEFSG